MARAGCCSSSLDAPVFGLLLLLKAALFCLAVEGDTGDARFGSYTDGRVVGCMFLHQLLVSAVLLWELR